MLRALFFVESGPAEGSAPAATYRVYQYLPLLARRGVRATVLPSRPPKYVSYEHLPAAFRYVAYRTAFAARALLRCAELPAALAHDVVFLQRELFASGPPLLERALRRLNGALVFDFDDAIWLHSEGAARRLETILALSREVIAGNTYLAEFAARHTPNVTVIPTAIDTDAYTVRPAPPPGGALTIGWMGTPGNFEHLAHVQEPLRRILDRYPHVRLKVVSRQRFRSEPPLPHIFESWEKSHELRTVHGFDIGIMPLIDTPFTRGKCGAKALVCMACGIPVVASPVGVNSDIIRDGVDGFLATTPGEWEQKLAALVEDAALRERLGREGRRTTELRYSIAVHAPRLLDVLVRAAAPAGTAGDRKLRV